MKPGKVDCSECHETHAFFGDAPPCAECGKPNDELMPEGETAYRLWCELHKRDRQYWHADGMPLALTTETVRGLVQDYGLSLEMQELILALDDEVTRMLQEEHKRKAKKK